MKPCLKVLMVAVVAVLGGCTPVMNSRTVDTPNGHTNCTQTKYGLVCNQDSVEQYKDCMRTNTEQMTRTGADAYCRCLTNGGVVIPSQNPSIPPTCSPGYGGVANGGMMGGYGATAVMPGRYANYPGSSVVFVPDPTPQGVVNMENAGGGGRFVPAPGSQPAGTGGASQKDVEDLARSQMAQQAAHCKHFPGDCICNNSCKK